MLIKASLIALATLPQAGTGPAVPDTVRTGERVPVHANGVRGFGAKTALGTRSTPASDAVFRSVAADGTIRTYVGADGALDIPAPFRPEAEMKVDGRLDEGIWQEAALLSGFTQYDPVEGIPASQETDVRVLVTDEAVLFGIRAHEEDGDAVRATLARRDGFGRSDDYVRIVLDTFNDNRRAYVFQVNPLGVQGDGLWVEGSEGRGDPIDWNPDFLWESSGRVDAGGYTVELKIPLKSLRFPEAATQDWGLQVVRRIQRNGFEASWAPMTDEKANKLAQSGTLAGLAGLEPGRMLELNPVVTATRQGSWNAEQGSFSHAGPTGAFGFNVVYGLTSNLTLDATFNPDFSQVEADAGQITVNERFALYLPEKRPFFLEGTDVFNMPRRLVYTRSIANPVGATKLSGKVGSFNVAYIGAVDDRSSVSGNPVVNLLRVKRDLGSSSSIGAVYTDRTLSGDRFNRVLGADGRFVLAGRYTLDVLASTSADRREGASTEWGSLVYARFDRSSRSLSLNATFEDVTDDFHARSGFIRRVGTTRLQARTGYTWRGEPGALLERWGPSVELQGYWDRQDFWAGGSPEESEVELSFFVGLRGNVGGYLSYSRDFYTFHRDEYEGLFLPSEDSDGFVSFAPSASLFGGLDAFSARTWISRWERARISLGGSWSETPIFVAGVPADVGESRSGDLNLTLYPTGSLSLELGLRHVTLTRKRDGSRYSSATIPRLSARYQFSRALFLRVVGEYSSQERGDVLDPVTGAPVFSCGATCVPRTGSDAHDFRMEGLAGYEPSPGTVVFLGYTRQMRDAEAFGFRDVTTRADGLFLKLSYRFRM